MLRIIPVLDVRNGIAVHARGGDRAHYAPLTSILHEGHDPFELAKAFHEQLGSDVLYLADLDAIEGRLRNLRLYKSISELPMTAWVDAGIKDAADAGAVVECGVSVVAGLETVRGPQELTELIERFGADRVVFSLDLRAGTPVTSTISSWPGHDPSTIAHAAVCSGIKTMIVLDLARVGTNSGLGTLPLIAAIHQDHPKLELIAGGGIAGSEDLESLEKAGAWAALVGSALHDGRLGR